MASPPEPQTPLRRLGGLTATMLVVASMIGTGVFVTTGLLVRDIGSLPAVLLAWAVGGLTALAGALAYAELVAALPSNGGEYQLLSRIYHPAVGFMAGVVSLVVGFSASLAATAIAFGEYTARALPGTPAMPAAIGLVVVMSILHAVHVTLGSDVQNAATIGKVAVMLVFVAAGAIAGNPSFLAQGSTEPMGTAVVSPSFAVGLVYVSFSYMGWNAAAYVAGEVRDPGRALPWSLIAGTTIVTLVYLALNAVYLMAAPASELAGEVEVAHVAAVHLMGEGGGKVVSGIIALGLVSTVGAIVMTGPRIYEAMGWDYRRLRMLARRREGGGPIGSIVLQAVLSIAMIATATFDALLTFIGFTLSVFSALTVVGVFVLRVREPELTRPYRTWGHPWTTLAFLLLMGWMIAHTLIERPTASWIGLGTLAAGLGLYRVARGPRRHVGAE